LQRKALYEQIRGELLNFHDSHGVVQHLPRVRFRFGQNLHLGEGGERLSKPYLGFYQEVVLQFPGKALVRQQGFDFAPDGSIPGAGFIQEVGPCGVISCQISPSRIVRKGRHCHF
jgi:hypothetical protein